LPGYSKTCAGDKGHEEEGSGVKKVLHIDLETRSLVDLIKSGVYVYVENPYTEILCACYAMNDDEIKTWFPVLGEPAPQDLIEAILDPEVTIAAHNFAFERLLLIVVGRKYLPANVIAAMKPHERWTCTAARSAAVGLPRSLDGSANALRITEQKDKEGALVMKSMCSPKRIDENGRPVFQFSREELDRLAAYCRVDVQVERAIDKQLPELSPFERKVWIATERMNDRGLGVDAALVERMAEFVKEAEAEVNAKINRITNGRVPKVTNTKKLKEWLADNDIVVDNVAKNTLKELLSKHFEYEEALKEAGENEAVLNEQLLESALPGNVKEILLLRQSGGKSSAGKYKSIIARMNKDGRARGSFLYCGAQSTGRWASRGTNLQNLSRGNGIEVYNQTALGIKNKPLDIDAAISAIIGGATVADIERDFGPPMICASDLVRPAFCARTGAWLVRSDYSQIEARITAWLGCEEKLLQAFRDYDAGTGPDTYLITAALILSILRSPTQPHEVSKADRQTFGKVPSLACSYNGGVNAFLAFARLYGVNISEEDAQTIVNAFRTANPGITAAWALFDRASKECVEAPPGQKFWAGTRPGDSEIINKFTGQPKFGNINILPRVYFKRDNRRMAMVLPSGRPIFYWYPKMEDVTTSWGAVKKSITYMAIDSQSQQWRKFSLYGGLAFQNAAQALARDYAANALVLLDECNLFPVLTCHDEHGNEIPISRFRSKDDAISAVEACMLAEPFWAKDLPIAVDSSANFRYVKA
jgi:DNA polymerase